MNASVTTDISETFAFSIDCDDDMRMGTNPWRSPVYLPVNCRGVKPTTM